MSMRGEKSTTAITYLYFDPALTFERRVAVAHELVASDAGAADDAVVGVTGVVPARIEQASAILDSLPAITAGTLLLILLVVGIWQRSLLAPLDDARGRRRGVRGRRSASWHGSAAKPTWRWRRRWSR